MKRNLFALTAVVLALVVSSFTTSKRINVYLSYSTSGTQENLFSNYTQGTTSPGTFTNSSPARLAWFRVSDISGVVSEEEFGGYFEAADATNTNSNTLTDETEDGIVLEFR